MTQQQRVPILVTGVPRSGTTWVSRLLAAAPHTAMPGREPMNPRGRQFALGGLLSGWVRRTDFAPSEARVIRRCYLGRETRTFSRYGVRQWAAPLPQTRVVVKDPFALLSILAVHESTGAVPVLVFRDPVSVLASYRRMGWRADTDELTALGAPAPRDSGDAAAMISMWSWMHEVALRDLDRLDDAVLVSHHTLTVGGRDAWDALFERVGLTPSAVRTQRPSVGRLARRRGRGSALHDFDRSASSVEEGWRSFVDEDESTSIRTATASVWEQLVLRQLRLPGANASGAVSQPSPPES